MKVHAKDYCIAPCPIHHPSDHHMKNWPTNIRESSLVERMCPHGVGHPDPDSVRWLEAHSLPGRQGTWSLHGCDGCCDPERDNPYGSPEVL